MSERPLQRVVLPMDRDLDVLPLYAELRPLAAAPGGGAGLDGATAADLDAGTRRAARIPAARTLSFCTYFNAFPAGYWRRWTILDEVRLRLRLRGDATVVVYRSNAKGHAQRVTSLRTAAASAGPGVSRGPDVSRGPGLWRGPGLSRGSGADAVAEHVLDLPLTPFIDGGWYWFDVTAGHGGAVLEEAVWCAVTDRAAVGRVCVGITTHDRPRFCVEQLLALGRTPEVLDVLEHVFVVDQGTRLVADHPDFAGAAAGLGGRLRVIRQGNLGGSGGFARAMHETVESGRADYVLLLDDDVVTEPEGILRAVAFADLARTPTMVGGHMFSLYDRSVLHAYGETLARYRWFWGPAPHTHHGHDFARHGLRDTPWLHRRVDVDYNGWWMCLVPTDVIRKVGLPMPMFIKWDDAEYGVRAKAAGFPTASLPGVAVWHVPWHDKDDTIDWQAYFHERNRLVSALLHSPYERGGNLIKESFYISVKHALAMQYSAAELMLAAIEDVLRGPGHMHAGIVSKPAEIRALRARFPDAEMRDDLDAFPAPRRRRPPRKGREPVAPEGRPAMLRAALMSSIRQLRPVDEAALRNPQAVVPHADLRWWLLSGMDSALVSAADGTRAAWYQRDPGRFRSVVGRSMALHARLLRDWSSLSTRYRAAVSDLTSAERWCATFEASRSSSDGPAESGESGESGSAEPGEPRAGAGR